MLLVTPAVATSFLAASANAQTSPEAKVADSTPTLQQLSSYGAEGKGSINQVTSVSQLTDVKPTDWAFQALQSLVERYGCIVGYPDKTYRGNRALTRYEFAAGLNACLDKIQDLIAAATADFVKKEDLEVIKRLQEEFAAELSALRGRVDALEVRTATLEKQQFSTTTKLRGEVIFGIADTFGDRATRTGNDGFLTGVNANNENSLKDDQTETVFQDRVRLSLDTSFTGKDLLRTRLEAKNAITFSGNFTGTNSTRLSYDGDTGNNVRVDKLYYRFPVGKNLKIQIDAINDEVYDALISALSPFESSGQGSVSRFGRFNPLYRVNNPDVAGSSGITFEYKFSNALLLQGGYLADRNSNDPSIKNGLFNGANVLMGQVVFKPGRTMDIGFNYSRAYYPGNENPNLTGSTGTGYAQRPFINEATTADNFSLQLQWRVMPKITVGGWYGYTIAHNRRTDEEARLINWAAFLGFPDLGGKGNLGGIVVGMQPRVVDNDFRPRLANGNPNPNARRRLDEAPPMHVEAFYRYRLNDNISITPGVFWIFNPEGNDLNNNQVVGVIRTTFTF
jgi:hypothetical protein